MMRLPLGLLVLCYISGIADTDTYKKGGKAVLLPGCVSDPITSITWKHGADIAVEWYGQETIVYRDFKGRCEVDTTTGVLIISNLSLKDSGSYTAEINSNIMETTDIKVITAVPKPTISTHCNPEVTQCTFTCDASIIEDTGPINYSWKIGDRQIPASPSNWFNITKDDTESVGKRISCQLENPVSRKRSDDIMSPFTNGRKKKEKEVHPVMEKEDRRGRGEVRFKGSSAGVNIAAVIVAIVLVLIALGILGVLTHYLIWRSCRAENENTGCRQYVAWLNRSCLNCGRTERTAEVAFSVENETLNQDQVLGSPEAKNQTEALSGLQETTAQHPTPAVPPETTSEPESAVKQEPEVEAMEDQRFLHAV